MGSHFENVKSTFKTHLKSPKKNDFLKNEHLVFGKQLSFLYFLKIKKGYPLSKNWMSIIQKFIFWNGFQVHFEHPFYFFKMGTHFLFQIIGAYFLQHAVIFFSPISYFGS